MLDEDDLVIRAEGLREGRLPRNETIWDAAASKRYVRWRRYLAGGDKQRMRRCLDSEGFQPGAVCHRRFAPSFPAWLATVRRLADAARVARPFSDKELGQACEISEPIPFSDLLSPCREAAGQWLEEEIGRRRLPMASLIIPAAMKELEGGLLSRLSHIATPTLYEAFSEGRGSPPIMAFLLDTESAPRLDYERFVRRSLADGYATLFRSYPVLARSLAIAVTLWIEATVEMLERINDDGDILAEAFFPARLPVVSARTFLSDTHAGGRAVTCLTLTGGHPIAYKPRPVDMEASFTTLLAWLNREGLSHPHRYPSVAPRNGYGWMEWIDPAPCDEATEVQAYWWRAGSLMALYRFLNGIDMHFENLVAAGAFPILVDLECLLHPPPDVLLREPLFPALAMPGVFMTGLLPQYTFADGGKRPINYGGLGPSCGPGGLEETRYRHINTDWMARTKRENRFPTEHLPIFDGRPADPRDDFDALLAGYQATGDTILANRDWLTKAFDSPLQALRKVCGRYMPRSSWVYGILLESARSPMAMADGIDFSITFEPLCRNIDTLPEGFRALVPHQRADLERLDVPKFGFVSDDTRVYDAHGKPIAPLWSETPFAAMIRQLQSFEQSDLDCDTEIITRAFTSGPRFDTSQTPVGSSLRDLLRAIADSIVSAGVVRRDGAVFWMGLAGDSTNSALMPTPCGFGLYSGAYGIAFFLAAAAHVLVDARYADFSRRALAPAREILIGAHGEKLIQGMGVGYARGLGGLLAALVWCGDLLDDPSLVEDAAHIAGYAEAISSGDRIYDLLEGGVGLILGLLLLYEQTKDASHLRSAISCGENILAAGQHQKGCICWTRGEVAPLAGMSHGASGFALALSQLYRATGEGRWYSAALAALAYEQRVFVPEAGNWPDLRPIGFEKGVELPRVRFAASWCHGAPGIALARIGIMGTLQKDDTDAYALLHRDLEAGLATTKRNLLLGELDDLCCGNAGRIDTLLTAGRILEHDDLVSAAMAAVALRAEIVAREGHAHLWHHELPVLGGDPGLFKGAAGFGLLLARILDPDGIPNVLLPIAGEALTPPLH